MASHEDLEWLRWHLSGIDGLCSHVVCLQAQQLKEPDSCGER